MNVSYILYGLEQRARISRTSAAGRDLGKEKKREALVCRARGQILG